MTLFDTARLFIAPFFAAIIARRFIERNRAGTDCGGERWRPVIDPMYLLSVCLAFFVMALIVDRTVELGHAKDAFAEVMLTAAVYDALLLLALPPLRRRFSARACAMLWLLPNVLYFVAYRSMSRSGPILMLPVRAKLDRLLWVWLAGAAAVMAWKAAEHLRFRRALLRNAREADAQTLALFQSVRAEMEEEASLREPLPLLLSPRINTPLSVGLWRRTLRVVLPERTYAPDELRLIFRHELIHIARRDAWTKLFLAVCTALMWWDPLMWLAMRRCADDLELGCDEFVLLSEPESERARYAELLLRTAGDERGFTTCLSATAKALRYRLENVLHPKEKLLGGALLGVVTAALILLSGSLAIAYAPQRLDEAALVGADAGEWYLNPNGEPGMPGGSGGALWEALRCREVYRLSGNYKPDAELWLQGFVGDRNVEIRCAGRFVFVEVRRYEERNRGLLLEQGFAFAAAPDWDALLADCARNAGA